MKNAKEKGPSLKERIKDKLPKVHLCLNFKKERLGKIAFVVVPLILAVVGASVGVYLSENNSGPVTKIEVSTNKVNRRVYLVSSDNLTIPLTLNMTKRGTTQEELVEVFSLLKENSKANTGEIKGLIPSGTKLNSLEIFENELILDVSNEFLNYNASDESKLLESIVYTYSEFPEVEMISLYVEGERLEKLPKNNTAVPMCMTIDMGINREVKKAIDISGKQMINVFYQKNIGDKDYLVPVSQYVSKDDPLEIQLVNAINTPLEEERGLKTLSDYSLVSQIQTDTKEEFVLNLKEGSLLEEGVVKRSLYDLLSLTMTNLVEAKEISFVVNEEVMMVEGLLNPEVYEVSSYVYNQIEI